MRKNFTQRILNNTAGNSNIRPSTASNSSYRNAGTYFTSPSGDRSGVIEAYRKAIPSTNIDENSILEHSAGLNSSTGFNAQMLG